MGGRGAYWISIGMAAITRTNPSIKNATSSANNKNLSQETVRLSDDRLSNSSQITFSPKQLGKKIRKHAREFGLDPSNAEDRKRYVEITKDILDHPNEKRKGRWRGQAEEVIFYARGKDVVIVSSRNEYITTLKGGISNAKYQRAVIL